MTTPTLQPTISCTPAAIQRIQELVSLEGNTNLKLRVYITGGGCSGFQYGFGFDEKLRADDAIIAQESTANAIHVVVDAVSLMYLNGAQIDYVENLRGSHFTVKNPNAQTTCSCGSSFSL